MYKNNDKPILVKVSLNRPVRMALKDFHPEATFTIKLKPGDLIVQKHCPLDATMRLVFVVGSINSEFITIYPNYFSTFEDAILKGIILRIKLDELTKSFWI